MDEADMLSRATYDARVTVGGRGVADHRARRRRGG